MRPVGLLSIAVVAKDTANEEFTVLSAWLRLSQELNILLHLLWRVVGTLLFLGFHHQKVVL